MAAAADASTVPGSVARDDTTTATTNTSTNPAPAAFAATSTTAPEAAVVTVPAATAAAPAEQTTQTTQTTTPPAAGTSSVSSSPAAQSGPVTSSPGASVLQVSSSQQPITIDTSQIPSHPGLSTDPDTITSAKAVAAPTTSNGLSTGAVAGIAVGCAIAGLVIGLLVAFFLLRRWSKSYPEAEGVEGRHGGKSFDPRAFTATPVGPVAAVSDLDQFLLAPRPDKELGAELQSLGHLIEQHVEDYYHLLPVKRSIGPLGEALAKLGLDVDDDKALPGPEQLAEMSANPRTRHAALRHVISRVIFESLAVRSASRHSMLPPAVSILVREMPPCEKHLGSPEAISHALARWRQLSAFLLNPNRSERGTIVPDEVSLAPRARDLAVAMNSFLGAFVEERSEYYQESHLQDVVLECAKLGYMVFSQPEDLAWRFDAGTADRIVVCPGLEKVSDSQGVGCRPEVICPPVVHRV